MVIDGRGSVPSILTTTDHQKTYRKYNRTPVRPATGTAHAPSLRPAPPCLIVTPTHQPPDREIRGAILGPGSAGAPDGEPVAVREPRGLPKAYRWKCGRTGVREAGREVIVVATGITCGMMRWSADTYKRALRVQVADGGYTPPVFSTCSS